ncbi:MAG: xanthine dehydrogenase accessory protein XdhC [Oligoflexia bacterium]|nr:MAG: xanthine dehydrogenase accessory protein XdhC [Oligoflexia bacterium]
MNKSSFEFYLEKIQDLKKTNQDFCTITLVHAQGSSPQEQGARCVVTEKGLQFGTIGGGKLEVRAIHQAQELLKDRAQQNYFTQWNLQKDIGMTCGGQVSLYFEIHRCKPHWQIVVFGAGHVGQELIPLLLKLDCHVTCVDSRSEWLSKLPDHPQLEKKQAIPMETYVSEIPDQAFVVSITMGHGTDLPILLQALKRNFPYVGCMGSDVKAKRIQKDLSDHGFELSQLQNFHCPIGLPFGNNTPIEIAFSIVGELLTLRDQQKSTRDGLCP